MHRYLGAFRNSGVHPDAGHRRLAVEGQHACLRQEVLARVLGTDADFDGVPGLRQLRLRPRQRLSGGHAQLRPHQIDAGHRFGDWMLDLEPGVDLEEVELGAVTGAVHQELHGAGVVIAGGLGERHGGRAHALPQRRGDGRRGRLLEHFLMAPLDRALALEQVHDGPVSIAKDLELDVTRASDQPFDVERAVAEGGLGFAPGLGDCRRQTGGVVHRFHADAAAPLGRLQQHGKADAAHGLHDGGLTLVGGDRARHHRHTGGFREPPGGGLRPQLGHRVGRRADEGHASRGTGGGELRILGQEPVAGMNRVGTGGACGIEDGALREVAVGGGGAADADGAVGDRHVQRARIGIGVDRHRLDAHLAARAHDAHRDLSAVGYEHPLEHGYIRKMPYLGGAIGALQAAEIARASASRVCKGSRIPSSHSRAVE